MMTYERLRGGLSAVRATKQQEKDKKMQNVLPLNATNPLRAVTGLARQISLPGEHAPLRYPSYPALERTAVIGFNQPTTLPLAASTSVAVTMMRQACYPAWADQSLTVFHSADYPMQSASGFTIGAGTTTPLTLIPQPAISNWTSGVMNPVATATRLGTVGGTSPNPYALLGRDSALDGPEFIYCAAGTKIALVVSSTSAASPAANVVLAVETWQSPGQTSSGISGAGTLNFPIVGGNRGAAIVFTALSVNSWIRPTSVSIAEGPGGAPGDWTVSIVSGTGTLTYAPSATTMGTVTQSVNSAVVVHFPLVYPIEFANSALPWFAARVTAAAILGTNVAQVLNKGGTVLGGRVSPAVQNAWNVPQSYINGLHPAEKAFLPLETGVYTYCPPSTDMLTFTDYTINTNSGAVECPIQSLSNDSMYNKIFFTAAGAVESLACTVTWHMEFRTSSSLFQIGLSPLTLESLHTAQIVLAETGFFFENPEHDKVLSKVISMAKKFAPDVVSSVNPVMGSMLRSLMSMKKGKPKQDTKVLKPKPGPSKPPATSGARSGMGGKGGGKGGRKKR